MGTEALLLTSDVAKLRGVGPSRIRQLANEGKLPFMRTVGGVRLFRLSDVERFERQRAKDESRRLARA